MKKLVKLALVLLAALMLAVCACKKAPETERLSVEELLSLPAIIGESDRVIFKHISEIAEYATFVKGTAVSVKYYLGLDSDECCTLTDFRIEEVIDEYNCYSVKPGDTVTILSYNSLNFADVSEHIKFMAEKTGLDIGGAITVQEAIAAHKERGENKTAALYEVVPTKGVDYRWYIESEASCPLLEGESYIMALCLAMSKTNEYYQKTCYFAAFFTPLNEELSYEKLKEKYGWNLVHDPVDAEIAALFK